MQIAELFINLGVKGTEKTVGAFTGMQKGLGETKSMALETKVALVALMYSLEQLFAVSNQKGTNLVNFTQSLDTSMKTLQQYQYAARQAGVSNDEVDSSFKSLSASMTKIMMGKGLPEYWAQLSEAAGITTEDIEKATKNPEILVQKFQIAAKKLPKNIFAEAMKGLVGGGMADAIHRNVFSPETLNKAPTLSDKEALQLDKNRASWANLGNQIEMAIGHFNSKHGQELVKGISEITEKVLKLVEAFTVFAEKMKLFETIGKVFEGWSVIFDTLGNTMDQINGKPTDPNKMTLDDVFGKEKEPEHHNQNDSGVIKFLQSLGKPSTINPKLNEGIFPSTEKTATPSVTPASTSNNVNVNQNLHFHGNDGKDMGKVSQIHKEAFKDAVKHTYRSNPAQAGGI